MAYLERSFVGRNANSRKMFQILVFWPSFLQMDGFVKDRTIEQDLLPMCLHRISRLLQSTRLRRFFVKDEEGATAVEFAMIGAPFFALIGFMLLGGHILWISQSMDTSVQSVSRQIRTGQAQAAAMGMAQFRNAVCSSIAMAEADCRANLIVDVRRFDSPENINFNPPRNNGSIDQQAGAFQIGDREDYVIVKVYLAVEYFSQLASLFGTGHDLDFHLSATAAFRNEPF